DPAEAAFLFAPPGPTGRDRGFAQREDVLLRDDGRFARERDLRRGAARRLLGRRPFGRKFHLTAFGEGLPRLGRFGDRRRGCLRQVVGASDAGFANGIKRWRRARLGRRHGVGFV